MPQTNVSNNLHPHIIYYKHRAFSVYNIQWGCNFSKRLFEALM